VVVIDHSFQISSKAYQLGIDQAHAEEFRPVVDKSHDRKSRSGALQCGTRRLDRKVSRSEDQDPLPDAEPRVPCIPVGGQPQNQRYGEGTADAYEKHTPSHSQPWNAVKQQRQYHASQTVSLAQPEDYPAPEQRPYIIEIKQIERELNERNQQQ